MKSIAEIQDNVAKLLCDYNIHLYHENQNIFINCIKNDLTKIIKLLKENEKTKYDQLIDITAIDYINNNKRFEIVYFFLSLKFNSRLIIKTQLTDKEEIDSIYQIFESANWYERECYDLFGINFKNHPDLRRIMTDYNFVGHPLRKDFPLTGHTEVRYDELSKKVIYEPVKLQQDYRNFDYSSPWEGISKDIIIDSKSPNNEDETE
tara:strand:- start:6403 stop:7020 length:618 start_codon:yes stop_codon:yes gene_type:complete